MPKIVRFHEVGNASVLKIEELPIMEPGAGEVRIKVQAIGLNRAEVLFRQGVYLEKPKFPSLIGYEAAGVVESVGPGVTDFKIGDRVSKIPAMPHSSMGRDGVYGETAIVPAIALSKYPDNLTAEEGASIWMQYLTAYGALVEYGKVKKGDFVLITAASSSVGYAAIQIVKDFGAIAIATTRGITKKDILLKAGADHVIVTDTEDLVKRVHEITAGHGADIIFDPVAGKFVETLANCAAYGSTIYEYGALSLEPTPFPLWPALQKGLSVKGYTLFEITANPEKLAKAKIYVSNALQTNKFKPIIDKQKFSLDQIVAAHEYMESNQQNGKIVVTVK
jgi:NADPH:quinone reductase-like Zn-dependent oxidoreductase